MAQTSGFFEAEYDELSKKWDREYFAAQFAQYFSLFIGNGVFASPTNQLKVVAGTGLSVTVKKGWAFINGLWYYNDSDLTVSVAPNTTSFPRKDSIMCRYERATRKITVVHAESTTEVSRTKETYDLKLAALTVPVAATSISDSDIEDTRVDEKVCGMVTGLLEVAPTDDLFQQFTDMFNTWFETIKDTLSGDVAGNLQNQITETNSKLEKTNSNIGTLSALKTSAKNNLVEAINEVNAKEPVVLDTKEEIQANSTSGKVAGALALKNMLGGITFGFTPDGEAGYIKGGADTVIPFKNTCVIANNDLNGIKQIMDKYYGIANSDIGIKSAGKNVGAIALNFDLLKSLHFTVIQHSSSAGTFGICLTDNFTDDIEELKKHVIWTSPYLSSGGWSYARVNAMIDFSNIKGYKYLSCVTITGQVFGWASSASGGIIEWTYKE